MSERIAHVLDRVGEARLLIAIAGIAFVAQLVNLHAPSFFGEPYLVAKNIAAGMGYVFAYPLTGKIVPTCYVTPLYVYLQVPFLVSGLGERGIQVMNLIFLQAACFVLYRFFRRFTSRNVALLIFLALSFYVPFWILAYTLDPNSLNILLLALTVDRLYVLSKFPTTSRWIQLGILIGLQLLLRPDILLGGVLFAVWLLVWNRSRLAWQGIVIAVLISCAIVAPWTIRNYLTFHKFVLVSANSGMNLYEGNNPVATGEFRANPPNAESIREFEETTQYANTHDAIDLDHYRLQLAEQWILHHPADAFMLDLRKVWYHWFGRPIMGEQFHYQYQALATAFRIAGVLMLVLGLYGLYYIRDNRLRSLLLVVFFYSTLVSAIFFVQSRHRILKVDPFLLPLAVIGVCVVANSSLRRLTHTTRDLEVADYTMSIRITSVEPGTIADELGIRAGDELLTMNGEPIHDELDFKFHTPGETLEIELYLSGAHTILEIEKEHDEEIGFAVQPMKMTACGNDCVFCFVDQNPQGLRKALYFRDGDYRFSHLYGNFNTMTNVGPKALERIVRQRLMPQYVSVHSTDLEVRTKLMRLRKDDHILDKLHYLAENDIWMHTQIVLCPGINDGASLAKTIEDIYALGPAVQTMAIVPVGLTSHRGTLTELKQVDKAYARTMIEMIFDLQKKFRNERGMNWLYLSDEWFLVAEMEVPDEEWYDSFPQLENGVGMVRDFIEETRREVNALKNSRVLAEPRRLTLATATLASGFMRENIVPILETIPNLEVDLEVVVNTLYGLDVTVTGLLSGQCFESHFHDRAATDLLLLPPNVLNEDDVFLDDETPLGLKRKLGDRPMAIFHGSWEEVLHYIEHPEAEMFDAKKMKLPVMN